MLSPHTIRIPNSDPAFASRALWLVLVLITLWRLGASWVLPVTRDEAYYFAWAHSLAWGYFDHPPGVALLGIGTLLAPASALAGRLGTVLAATLTLLVLVRFYRACGLRDGTLLIAVVMAGMTLPGLASGVLATPDTALALGWALALHEGLAALRGERRRWLGAGIATGLGLLGKYTMVLIGPVFLWAILWMDPKALRTPWPYLGGLLALLVFAPNLLWNAQNDWLTMRFQFGHGFSTETGTLVANALPVPIADSQLVSVPPSGAGSSAEGLGGLLSYVGIQVALWGLFTVPLAFGLVRRHGQRWREGSDVLDPAAWAVLIAGTLFPLAFFAPLAVLSEVEPNWPAMYLATAAPLAAILMSRVQMMALVAAGGNVLLASLYLLHGATGMLPLPDSQNRILRETLGYPELAHRVADSPGPLFADRYQIAAMVQFYEPARDITQWPGITRPSEYVRGTIAATVPLAQIERAGGFRLVSRKAALAHIPGFRLESRSRVYYCLEGGLVERAVSTAPPPCRKPLHRWELYDYVMVTGETGRPTPDPLGAQGRSPTTQSGR